MSAPHDHDDRPAVVVIGSVNRDVTVRVDRFPTAGETVLGTSVSEALGGKGANQAVAAARAGARVHLLATVGDDTAGRALCAELAGLGVATDLLDSSTSRPTGRAHITVDRSGQNSIIVIAGANVETTAEKVGGIAGAVSGCGVLVVQGEVPPETVTAVLTLGKTLDVPVILNLAPVIPLPAGALKKAAVLVVNEAEAAALASVPEPRRIEEGLALARRLSADVPAVVLTMGPQGAVVAERDGAAVGVPAPAPQRVIDSVGAGDALVGVLAASLANGTTVIDAVTDGVRAATSSVERAGAGSSYPRFWVTAPDTPVQPEVATKRRGTQTSDSAEPAHYVDQTPAGFPVGPKSSRE